MIDKEKKYLAVPSNDSMVATPNPNLAAATGVEPPR